MLLLAVFGGLPHTSSTPDAVEQSRSKDASNSDCVQRVCRNMDDLPKQRCDWTARDAHAKNRQPSAVDLFDELLGDVSPQDALRESGAEASQAIVVEMRARHVHYIRKIM